MKIIAEQFVHINTDWNDVRDLLELAETNPDAAVDGMSMSNNKLGGSFVCIGKAKVIVDLGSDEDLVRRQIDALRAKREQVLAESQSKLNLLDERIKNLQALAYDRKEN